MKSIFNYCKKLLFYNKKKKLNQGFTLTELLVVMIISSLIIAPLLTLMFGLLEDNQKEMAYSETQQEMRRALTYMANELKGAVYVYDGTELNNLVSNSYLPNFGSNTDPVFAFWKVEKVPYSGDLPNIDCTASGVNSVNDGSANSDLDEAECTNLQIERRSYTLVVYLQSTDNPSNLWEGQSRIFRYELRKFNDITATTLTRNTGFVDPRSETTFANWPIDIEGNNVQDARPVADVNNTDALVDFVDIPTSGNTPTCDADYTSSPANLANSRSFYVCVRSPLVGQASVNQDVIVYLRGNSQGKYGTSNTASLPVLQTQILNRGVIDKIVD